MEEGKAEDKLAPDGLLLAVIEIGVAHFLVATTHVCFDAARRLGSQLNSILKHRNREVRCRHRGQEKSEGGVDVASFSELNHNLFEIRHPT